MREWDFETGPRGLGLRVCEWGEPAGPPLIILHGFLEQGAAWDGVARRLAAQLPARILAPDQRGHGRSEHIGRGGFYHFWDYVGDLDALVRSIGGPIALVGHSMGGTVAALYAGTRPAEVSRLVLVEGLGPQDMSGHAVERARAFLDHLAVPRRHEPVASVDEGARRMRRWNTSLSEASAVVLAGRVLRPEGDALTWTWDALHRARSPRPFRADAFTSFLREVQAPTLLVDGTTSWMQLPDRADREAALQRARRVVIEGGHLLHHDAPAALADHIVAHLQEPT